MNSNIKYRVMEHLRSPIGKSMVGVSYVTNRAVYTLYEELRIGIEIRIYVQIRDAIQLAQSP